MVGDDGDEETIEYDDYADAGGDDQDNWFVPR
jgi:hypothetical protein